MSLRILFLFVLLLSQSACTISLINTTIDYSKVSSFTIEQFDTKASNAPPTSGQQFSERLKNKILNNTRLSYRDEDGDLQFEGSVTNYRVTALAPQANQTVSLQRLTVQITVDYNNTTAKKGAEDAQWNKSFSRFADFGADQDLVSVEEQLLEEIYDQVIEDVFNKTFSGW